MFSKADTAHLLDILESCQAIQAFLVGFTITAYQADRKTRRPVEREFQILTEAAYRLGDQATVFCPSVDWRGVRGLGNFLRHEYDKVDDSILWDAVQTKLPHLQMAVQQALNRLSEEVPENS